MSSVLSHKCKVLLIEPSILITQGLTGMLDASGKFAPVQTLSDLSQYEHFQFEHFDVIIVDPVVVNYAEQIHIRNFFPHEDPLTLIALTYFQYDDRMMRQYDDKINFYDTAEHMVKKILDAIASSSAQDPRTKGSELSVREKEVLVEVAKGFTNKEIADRLNLSVYTVVTHRKNISRKLDINSISGLTVYAIMNKLLDASDIGY